VAEQDTFGSLLAGLRRAPGVVPKLRILGNGARSLRRLSPRERGVLLKMAGLGGAEALVERLATGDRGTDQAFRRLLIAIEQHPEELGDNVRGLLDPARRAEAASALIHHLDEALNPDEEEPAEAAEDAPGDSEAGEPAGTPPAASTEQAEPAEPTAASQPTERKEPAERTVAPVAPVAAAKPADAGAAPRPARRLPPPLPSAGPPGPPRPPQPRPQPPAEAPPKPEPERAAEPEPQAERTPAPEPLPKPAPVVPPAVPPPPTKPGELSDTEEAPDPWAARAAESPTREPARSTGPSRTLLGVGAAAGAAGVVGLATRAAPRDRADLDELLAYRRRLSGGGEPTLAELEERLDDEAPSWTYRRTLQAWIGSASAEELVAGLDRLLALIAAQPRPGDRLWCLSALARRHAWADDEWERIAELAGSPALLRRLEGLRRRKS